MSATRLIQSVLIQGLVSIAMVFRFLQSKKQPFVLGLCTILSLPLSSQCVAKTGLSASSPKTGTVLAALSFARHNDIDRAETLLYKLVANGHDYQDLRNTALFFALLSGNKDAPAHALAIARMIPNDPQSAIVLGMEAMRQHDWAKAAQFFTFPPNPRSLPYGTSLFTGLAPVLKAWALVGANDAKGVIAALNNQPAEKQGLGQWYGVEKALLAYSMYVPSSGDDLLKKLASRDNVETERQLYYIPYQAALLAHLGRKVDAAIFYDKIKENWEFSRYFNSQLHADASLFPFTPLYGAADAFLVNGTLMFGGSLIVSEHIADKAKAQAIALQLRQTAIICERMALNLKPGFMPARIMLARALAANDQLEAARDTLRNIDPRDAMAPWALWVRATFEKADEDTPALIATLKDIVAILPANRPFRLLLAQAQAQAGQSEEALANLNRILNSQESFKGPLNENGALLADVFLLRAQIYIKMARPAQALDDLGLVLFMIPKSAETLNLAGYIGLINGINLPVAKARLKQAYAIDPKNPAIRDSYAWALMLVDHNVKKALPLLKRSAQEAPDDADAAYHLGVAYWYTGQFANARREWTRALKNSPDPGTLQAIKRAMHEGPCINGLVTPAHAPLPHAKLPPKP